MDRRKVPFEANERSFVMAATANEARHSFREESRPDLLRFVEAARLRSLRRRTPSHTAHRRELVPYAREAALRRYMAASARVRSSFIVSPGTCSARPMEASTVSFCGPDRP